MSNEVILNFVPTGMVPTKEITAHVPISPSEIVEQVHQANELGITLVHLHARDENGVPTYKMSTYEKIVSGIKRYCPELVICISLSGRNFNQLEKRAEALALKPDMGSLTLSSLNFSRQASVNDPQMIQNLIRNMDDFGVKPELEVFDLGMINYAHYLIKKGLLKQPHYFNIIAGNVAGVQCDLSQLGTMIQYLPQGSHWALGGIGDSQLKANMMGMIENAGVRVGIEDNIYFDQKRKEKATNIQLLERVHHLMKIFEKRTMSPRTFGAMGFYNKSRVF